MNASVRTEIKFNRLPEVRTALPSIVRGRIMEAVNAFREQVRESLRAGDHGIGADTGALVEGLYVLSEDGSDYAERLAAAERAYTENPSFWKEIVQKTLDPKAYTAEHFAARVDPETTLPELGPNVIVAVMAAIPSWGRYWELGHSNHLTGKYEQRPWLTPEEELFARRYATFFQDLLRDLP